MNKNVQQGYPVYTTMENANEITGESEKIRIQRNVVSWRHNSSQWETKNEVRLWV